MKTALARIHNGLAWFVLVGGVIQLFLIALVVFGESSAQVHSGFGGFLMLAALLSFVVSLLLRSSRQNVLFSLLMFLMLFPLQGVLAYVTDLGPLRGLHAVNGLAIMGVAHALARGRYRALAPERAPDPMVATAD